MRILRGLFNNIAVDARAQAAARRSRWWAFVAAACFAGPAPHVAEAQTGLVEATHLLDVWVGSVRSDAVRSLRRGNFELADGTPMSLDSWYRPQMPEVNLVMMTQLTPGFGLLWGLSSGEGGEKYRIAPGLHLGFTFQKALSEQGTLSMQMMGMLGGRLKEDRCTADFGEIGGVVPVNCRLAGTYLSPEETLRHLLRMSGRHEFRASLRYDLRF